MPQLQATQPLLNPAASSWSPTAVSASLQHNSRFLHNAMSGAQRTPLIVANAWPRAAPVALPPRRPAARRSLRKERSWRRSEHAAMRANCVRCLQTRRATSAARWVT